MAGTMTSSPGPMPRACIAVCSAAVPLLTASGGAAPTYAPTDCSKAATFGPVVSQFDRTTSTSGCSIDCRPEGGPHEPEDLRQ
jgi:hypothetical protein